MGRREEGRVLRVCRARADDMRLAGIDCIVESWTG
jgi:hypothetical protein